MYLSAWPSTFYIFFFGLSTWPLASIGKTLNIQAFYTGVCLPHSQIDGTHSGGVRMKGKQRTGASVTLKGLSTLTLPQLGAFPSGPNEMCRASLPSSYIWCLRSLQLSLFFFLLKMICSSNSSPLIISLFGPKPLISGSWAKKKKQNKMKQNKNQKSETFPY